MNKIEVRFAEEKQRMNSLKIKLKKYSNVTRKRNNVEQVQVEY